MHVNVYKSLYKPATAAPKQNLAEYIERFSFLKHVYYDKASQLKLLIDVDRALVADLVAAVITQHIVQHADVAMIRDGLRCARDILLSEGYLETDLEALHNKVREGQSSEHIVVIPGCQSDTILEHRVEAALRVIEQLRTHVHVIFVGARPAQTAVRIPDESKRMKNLFESRQSLMQDPKMVKTVRTFRENVSTNTEQNIRNFFKLGFVDAGKDREGKEPTKYTVYVVSSTFHLIRIARVFQQCISSPDYKNTIQRVAFCGADPVNVLNKASQLPEYVKLMFFDIINHLLGLPEFDTHRVLSSTQGRVQAIEKMRKAVSAVAGAGSNEPVMPTMEVGSKVKTSSRRVSASLDKKIS